MITKAHALFSLKPEGGWICEGDKVTWDSSVTETPTEEEIQQEIAKLQYEEEVKVYQKERANAYPSYAEQFDQIFHEGIDAWKATIQAVKDAHPKAEIDEAELASRKAQALFAYQLEQYTKAKARLDRYELAVGVEEVSELRDNVEGETDEDGNIIQVNVVVQDAIEPVAATIIEVDADGNEIEVENPLITKDNVERAEAQAIVDSMPQEVIDAYNAE
jgi:hypothetical protein